MNKLFFLFFLFVIPVFSQVKDVSLNDLNFISGQWRGEISGGIIEEHWMEPEGDNMLGMFRMIKDGKQVFHELMIIEKEEDEISLKIKHFSPGLIAWEDKEEVIAFRLIELNSSEAVFLALDNHAAISMDASQEDYLIIQLKKKVEGNEKISEFKYKRKI